MRGEQQFQINLGNGGTLRIRGYKLLHMNSERDDDLGRERWINLRLFYSIERQFVLVIAYNTEVDSPDEQESSHVGVERCSSWADLAECLDTYDFMQHVRLDFHCGGHCALMEGVGRKHAQLRHRFRITAMAFLRNCLDMRNDWWVRHGIDLW